MSNRSSGGSRSSQNSVGSMRRGGGRAGLSADGPMLTVVISMIATWYLTYSEVAMVSVAAVIVTIEFVWVRHSLGDEPFSIIGFVFGSKMRGYCRIFNTAVQAIAFSIYLYFEVLKPTFEFYTQ